MAKVGTITETRLTCPRCGFEQDASMPVDACQFFYECLNCGAVLRPDPGDCCVFCSFADSPCPPRQQEVRR